MPENVVSFHEFKKKKRKGNLNTFEYVGMIVSICISYLLAISLIGGTIYALRSDKETITGYVLGSCYIISIACFSFIHLKKTFDIFKHLSVINHLEYLTRYPIILCVIGALSVILTLSLGFSHIISFFYTIFSFTFFVYTVSVVTRIFAKADFFSTDSP